MTKNKSKRDAGDAKSNRHPVISIEKQWGLAQVYRNEMTRCASELSRSNAAGIRDVDWSYPEEPSQALADLEHAWNAIGQQHPFPTNSLDREHDNKSDTTPIAAIVSLVSQGIYPPPELLLALRWCYLSYMDAAGEKALEECFFGKPKQKAGTHSRRERARIYNATLALDMFVPIVRDESGSIHTDWKTIRSENSEIASAERVARVRGNKIDAESLLRKAKRAMPGGGKKRPPGRPKGSRKKLDK